MKIEDVFSSKGRVRILRILVEIGELNISEIARRARLNYATADQHLKVLENSGLVRQRKFGRVRMYRFCDGGLRAEAVRKMIEIWEKTGKPEPR